MESASRPKKPSVTAKRKKKVAITEEPPNIRTYEVNNGESNTTHKKKSKGIKGSLRTRDPRPAPAPPLIDFEHQPKAQRKAIKQTLKWRAERAMHASHIATIEHELLNNNNTDDDMCHIIRVFAAMGNYTYKKLDTPFHIRAFLIHKYKRALSDANYNMLRDFNEYLHQKLIEAPSSNGNAPSPSPTHPK
jgi:hypothetical protein